MNTVVYNKKIESIFVKANGPNQDISPIHLHCSRVALANLNNTSNNFIELSTKRITKPVLNLKENLQIFTKSLRTHGAIVGSICGFIFLALIIAAIGVASFLVIKGDQSQFKQQILDKKWAVYFYNINPKFKRILKVNDYIKFTFDRYLNMDDYNRIVKKQTAALVIYGAIIIGGFLSTLIGAVIVMSYDLHKLMKQDRIVDKIEIYEKATDSHLEIEELSNETNDEGFFLDPFSLEPINPVHINYPRYIKLGNHLFTAPSFVKALLSHDLEAGRMKHPLQNRFLTEDEQNEILNKLQSLLGINGNKFLESFNIFNFHQFRSMMNIEQKAAFDADCLETYRHLLQAHYRWFRDFTPQQKDDYIAANKARAFAIYRVNNLIHSLDEAISLALDLQA